MGGFEDLRGNRFTKLGKERNLKVSMSNQRTHRSGGVLRKSLDLVKMLGRLVGEDSLAVELPVLGVPRERLDVFAIDGSSISLFPPSVGTWPAAA